MARDIYPRLVDQVEVVAVIDRHLERCEPLTKALGARSFQSLREALGDVDIDAADIRLQHSAHAAATVEALELGLHVLVEKPLSTTIEECARMIAAADAAGLTVGVAENYPHLGSVRAARAAIDDGVIGDILTLRTTRAYRLEGVWARTTWRQSRGPASGILWDQGTHHTSMIRALAGEVHAVSARSSTALSTAGAEAVALTLLLKSGLVAQSMYCWGAPAVTCDTEATVFGSSGRIDIRVDYDDARGSAALTTPHRAVETLGEADGYYDSHRLIVLDWIRAIREHRSPFVDLASATADVRVVLAAHRSLASGGAFIDVDSVRS